MQHRRLAAIMFTDIVGYTTLMGKDEDQAFKLLRKNREIQKKFIHKYQGEWLKEMGDGILASFLTASDAVRCAGEIQHAAKNVNIPLRIGIHEGEVVFEGSDVFGDGVNIASRIKELAEAGSIQISGAVYKDIKNKSGISSELIGEKVLKNVEDPVKIYKVTCEQSAFDLTGLKTADSNLPDKKSIIVLPFDDMSPDSDQEYFSDGLTEEIITDLSHIHDLLVISRSSAMTYKGKKKKIKKIAEEVNVQYVLEGSVRKAGNNLRIVAQLIDGLNDTHLWAEKYSGTLDDVFRIQEDVSKSIVEALKLKLSPEEETKLNDRPIDDPIAVDCYMKASYEIMRFTESSINRAIEYLQKGLDIVGGNALIYAGMGYAYFHYVNLGVGQEEYIEKAKEYTQKALELDPDCPQAHFTLGVLCMVLKDLKKGIYYLNKTLSADPNNIEALSWCGFFYYLVGKTDKANALWTRFTQLDPVNIVTPLGDGLKLFFDGKFGSAVPFFFKSYKTASDTPMLQFWYALSLAYNYRYEEVIPLVDQSLKSPNQDIWTLLSLFLKLAIQEDINGISNVLTDDFITSCKRDLQYSYHLATFYALMGQTEKTYEWLENAIDIGFINYPFINNMDPFLENLRGEERFKKLMERVKYEWENFEF